MAESLICAKQRIKEGGGCSSI